MLNRKFFKYIIAGCLIFAVGLILLGCNAGKHETAGSAAQTGTPAVTGEEARGSAQLWSENCGRCHNLRAPTSYSDVQWEVSMHHMRVRADLTATEQRKILEFLQASN